MIRKGSAESHFEAEIWRKWGCELWGKSIPAEGAASTKTLAWKQTKQRDRYDWNEWGEEKGGMKLETYVRTKLWQLSWQHEETAAGIIYTPTHHWKPSHVMWEK